MCWLTGSFYAVKWVKEYDGCGSGGDDDNDDVDDDHDGSGEVMCKN